MLIKNMDRKKRIEDLEKLRQNYLILREFVVYYKNALEYNEQMEQEKQKEQEEVKVKKLVLTKPFYGKNLVVG